MKDKNVKIFHPVSDWWQAQLAFCIRMWKILIMLKNHLYHGVACSRVACHPSVTGGF
jgi:hypothetical protein